MIAISTKTRATVEHDGGKVTVRPLTGAEKLEASEHVPMAPWVARTCAVLVEGVLVDGQPATTAHVDYLDPVFIIKIFTKVVEISNITRDEAKNSPSQPVSSPVESAT